MANVTRQENGQILVLFGFVVPLLLLFLGFGIDFGFAFLLKAELSKAVDAESLAIMRNLGRGQAQALAIGNSQFLLKLQCYLSS